MLNEKKKKKLDYDNKIISFLSEQRLIAKDLNIINHNHDLDHIIFLSETFKALTADPNLSSYYLRGVKFLDKQIDIKRIVNILNLLIWKKK